MKYSVHTSECWQRLEEQKGMNEVPTSSLLNSWHRAGVSLSSLPVGIEQPFLLEVAPRMCLLVFKSDMDCV